MSAKLKGNEVRVVATARIEPNKKETLVERFGSFQLAVDYLASKYGVKKNGTATTKTKTVSRSAKS